jgi:hypothetical protein
MCSNYLLKSFSVALLCAFLSTVSAREMIRESQFVAGAQATDVPQRMEANATVESHSSMAHILIEKLSKRARTLFQFLGLAPTVARADQGNAREPKAEQSDRQTKTTVANDPAYTRRTDEEREDALKRARMLLSLIGVHSNSPASDDSAETPAS